MQLTAKLITLLPLQTGQGKNGEWRKQDIILETDGQYPKKICISLWGDKINTSQLQIGNMLKVDFDIESREFNGRWYTDVKAWKTEVVGGSSAAGSLPDDSTGFPPPEMDLPSQPEEDLPF